MVLLIGQTYEKHKDANHTPGTLEATLSIISGLDVKQPAGTYMDMCSEQAQK